ncbi:hypothetical protein OG873_32860 [Streptomyces violaceus]|uniref:Uncharacterized protein n=1 Tax=Streptomyces violaceus TaxID=1936 RepID=A0ABZ1P0M1_STRVL
MGQGTQLPPDTTRWLCPRRGVSYVEVTDLEPWTAALGRLPRSREEPLVAALRQAAQRVLRRALTGRSRCDNRLQARPSALPSATSGVGALP